MVLPRAIRQITRFSYERWCVQRPLQLQSSLGPAAFSNTAQMNSLQVVLFLIPFAILAQAGQVPAGGGQRGGAPAAGQGAAPATQGARGAAPVDLTGYWVSIVTEDWIE